MAGIGWCAEEGTSDPKLIQSALSCTFREDGTEVRIDIYRLETTDWSLEVVDETGASTVWDDLFSTDKAALDEALKNDPRRRGQDISEWQNRHYALTLGFAEDVIESNPQNRRLGYARVSTYGQT
ncbi:MAG: hypothetical protein WA624_20975 [Methylocella sp.]